jgi:hypothetical protein
LLTAALVSTDEDLVPDIAIDRRIYQSPQFQNSVRFAFKLEHYGNGGSPAYYLLHFERKEDT